MMLASGPVCPGQEASLGVDGEDDGCGGSCRWSGSGHGACVEGFLPGSQGKSMRSVAPILFSFKGSSAMTTAVNVTRIPDGDDPGAGLPTGLP